MNEYIECDRCDGCGWYEGGPTIQTLCEKCNGEGIIKNPKFKGYHIIKGKLGPEVYVKDPSIGGYTAHFKDFPIISEGDTLEKAQENLWNAAYDVFKNLINFSDLGSTD